MKIVFFDTPEIHTALLPITFVRPAAELRVGALKISEKWERMLGNGRASFLTADYLSAKYPADPQALAADDTLYIAGNLLPNPAIIEYARLLEPGQSLAVGGKRVMHRGTKESFDAPTGKMPEVDAVTLNSCIDIFKLNGEELRHDYRLLTDGRTSAPLSPSCTLLGDPADLFIEDGVDIECSSINVKHGPVYIARGAEIMEGARLRGPLAIMEGAKVKMNAMIYEDTTIGPECRIAGECANAVFQGYSNKAHDGVALNCVIGEWCNLGAAATASNLKNTYAKIKVWSYVKGGFIKTDETFCGLIMGDHSKLAINTSLNTATTIGFGVNFFGAGFPRTYIPSFSFGSPSSMTKVPFDEFLTTARIVMGRRHVELTDADIAIYRHLYEEATH